MRSPEIPNGEQETTEQGFSEKKIARIREGRQVDNSQVKKRKPIVGLRQKMKRLVVRRDKAQALSKDPQDLIK